MRYSIRILAVLCFALLLTPLSAFGGPPYRTDDPEPVEYKNWELYLASQYQNNNDGHSLTAPHVEINYGFAPEFQIHFIFPMEYVRPTGGPSQYGYGDTEIGVKWRFFDKKFSEESEFMIGTFPMLEVPTGDESKGLGNGDPQFFMPIWLQQNWGKWTTYGGGGYWINPGSEHKDFWFFGWLVQREITKQLAIGLEIFHETPRDNGGDSNSGFNGGAVINITDNHHILLSAGRDFSGPNTFSSYVAYQYTFGPGKEKEGAEAH